MITKMKKILLAGKLEDREKVLTVLRSAESVHVDAAVPEKIKIPEALTEEYTECQQALAILDQVKTDKDEDCLATPGTPTRLVEETLAHNKTIAELKNKYNAVNREFEEVSKWGPVGCKDLEALKEAGLHIAFFKGPVANIGDIDAECVQYVFKMDSSNVIAAFSRNEIKAPEAFTEIPAPKREFSQVLDEIQSIEKAIQDNVHALLCLKQRYGDIKVYYNKLGNKRRFKEVETGVFCEDRLFVLTGWCPENKTKDLQKTFEDAGLSVGIDFFEPEEGEMPPTKLENNAFGASASPLLKLMGMTPSYFEPDTSFLFMLTLTVFASFIMADLGYGLLLALPLLLSYKKLVSKGVSPDVLRLLILLSSGTAVYGLITNSVFGFAPFGFGYEPGSGDMVLWQKLCLFIGAIHLTVAHVMKINEKPKNLATIGEVGWVVFLWAMYGLLCNLITNEDLGVFKFSAQIPLFGTSQALYVWLFELSAIMIILFTEPQKNIFKAVAAGIGSIAQNGSGMFSDILSYIRLWAVGLAGGKVAGAFNDIGNMAADKLGGFGIVLFVVVFLFGHLLNIILSCISVLAHGVRLNLLEFTNHLGLEWTGREYEPFKENNK